MKIRIDKDGTTRFIYSDTVRDLLKEGDAQITRASHVEPDPERPGFWTADMSPVGGPVRKGFELREEALRWEVEWLEQNGLGKIDPH